MMPTWDLRFRIAVCLDCGMWLLTIDQIVRRQGPVADIGENSSLPLITSPIGEPASILQPQFAVTSSGLLLPSMFKFISSV
jgi:hypothetical protein